VIIGEAPTFITLTDSKYPNLPNFLGNGAVGEVRFMLHDEASEPVNNGSGSNLSVIKLRFYGPVKFLDTVGGQQQPGGSKQPLLVEQEISQGNWVDVTSALSFEFKPFDETNGVFKTSILITLTAGGNFPTGNYRISKTQYLKSDLGGLLWAPVRDFGTVQDPYYKVTIN